MLTSQASPVLLLQKPDTTDPGLSLHSQLRRRVTTEAAALPLHKQNQILLLLLQSAFQQREGPAPGIDSASGRPQGTVTSSAISQG